MKVSSNEKASAVVSTGVHKGMNKGQSDYIIEMRNKLRESQEKISSLNSSIIEKRERIMELEKEVGKLVKENIDKKRRIDFLSPMSNYPTKIVYYHPTKQELEQLIRETCREGFETLSRDVIGNRRRISGLAQRLSILERYLNLQTNKLDEVTVDSLEKMMDEYASSIQSHTTDKSKPVNKQEQTPEKE